MPLGTIRRFLKANPMFLECPNCIVTCKKISEKIRKILKLKSLRIGKESDTAKWEKILGMIPYQRNGFLPVVEVLGDKTS